MTKTTHPHGDQHQHQHGQGDGHGHSGTAGGIAEILELDAEVLAEHTASIVTWLPVEQRPRRIVDLGCGTGVGTFALLAQFPDAHVTAVDAAEDHLHRVQDKAREAGLAEQIDTVRADLDAEWPDLGTPDLVWASASLHHLGDPDRALRRLRDILTPGGLLVVIEPDGFPRFLPDNAPEQRPGLEARVHEAADRRAGVQLPHRGADFGPLLAAAGFTVEGRRTITDAIDRSRSDAVSRYALIGLTGMRKGVADALSGEDLAALDQLLDPDSPQSLLHRDDLAVRTTRSVWAARP